MTCVGEKQLEALRVAAEGGALRKKTLGHCAFYRTLRAVADACSSWGTIEKRHWRKVNSSLMENSFQQFQFERL